LEGCQSNLEYVFGKIFTLTYKENGNLIKCMASENVSGRMLELIKEIMLSEKSKAMECIRFLMEKI